MEGKLLKSHVELEALLIHRFHEPAPLLCVNLKAGSDNPVAFGLIDDALLPFPLHHSVILLHSESFRVFRVFRGSVQCLVWWFICPATVSAGPRNPPPSLS